MTKSAWEARVGMLLSPPDFPYSFKPYDSDMYGGQPRLDWLACDKAGYFWAIEVKKLSENRKTFRLDTLVSAGQVQALNAVASAVQSTALLAVGMGATLFFYDWRKIQWLLGATAPPALNFTTDPMFCFRWHGPKTWVLERLYDVYHTHRSLASVVGGPSGPLTTPTPTPSELASQETPPDPSPPISKRAASIRMRRKMLLSGL